MVRFDEVPFHHLLWGWCVREAGASTGVEVARIADWRCARAETTVCLLQRQFVVAGAGHLLVAVVAVLIDVPDGQPFVGQ